MDQQDFDDVEAVSRLPEEHECEVPADERQRPSSSSPFGRRKKAIIAAVVSIAVAGAVAAGVALATQPDADTRSSPGQNGLVQSAAPAEDAEPSASDAASVAEPLMDEDADELSNEAAADESPSGGTPQAMPWKEDLPVAVVVDDPELDIIIDVGYEVEYPEDVILDGGFEQREPEEEEDLRPEITQGENVEFASEDFSLENFDGKQTVASEDFSLENFDGELTDFIVTPDMSRTTFTTSSTCPNANEGVWTMQLDTDNYPWETYWELLDNQNNVVAFGPPKGRNYARATKYIGQICFKAGRYKLRLGDKNNDGFCCKYGKGSMLMKVNGVPVANTNNEEAFGETIYPFIIRRAGNGNGNNGNNPKPSGRPTKAPSPPPTKTPSLRPTISLDQSFCAIGKRVVIKVVTDDFASETSYKFTAADNPNQVLLQRRPDSMRNEQTYEDSICAEDGQYRMTMTDPFKGIQKGGFYSVTVDGEQVMYGNTFSGGSESHIIDVGYQPPMTARDREWLNAHNTRREEFHREEGTSFKKLVWSPTLAEDASNWVDVILPTCKIVRQEMLGAGENISARTSGGERDEGPEPILSRWVDNKKDKDYPANQSLTQVFWSASRYVGCAEKSLQRENGTWCYVSLCRYARAGNCSMGKYPDWREGVLAARSQCGPICPDNVCY